jgi:hypothetical protein
MRYSKRIRSSQNGFILITALMACLILFALTMLIINLSTSDLRVSAQSVGTKKAMVAAEAGLHSMIRNFDPQNLASSAISSSTSGAVQVNGVWYLKVDPTNDPASIYTISTPTQPTTGPVFLPLTGYAIGGGQQWGQRAYNVAVTGRNTTYDTTVTIGVGFGYGPVEISTMMR